MLSWREASFLVIYVDVGFALLFYIICFKHCISFLLRMLVWGTSTLWTLRAPTGWISKLILRYCRNCRGNSIAEAGLGLVVPKLWTFLFGSLSEKWLLKRASPKSRTVLEQMGIHGIYSPNKNVLPQKEQSHPEIYLFLQESVTKLMVSHYKKVIQKSYHHDSHQIASGIHFVTL